MMAPFDGSSSSQQQSQNGQLGGNPMPRAPMAPGGHHVPAPVMPHHHQNSLFSNNMHRPQPGGMVPGGQFTMPQSSVSSRQNSFGAPIMNNNNHQTQQYQMHNQGPSNTHHMHQMSQQSHAPQSHIQHPQHMGIQSAPAHHAMGLSGGVQSSSGGDRQRQYIAANMNGNWQSDRDMQHRREMIQHM